MAVSALLGVDGYRGGWVGARLDADTITWCTASIGGIDGLVAGCAVAAIDIPIGLTERGWRSCDLVAKELLGVGRSRVFMTPPRAVVELGLEAPNAVAQERSRELTGQGVSRQALALSARILDVDRLLPDERIIEVHPELSFAELAGSVLPSKKSAAGVGARLQALRAWRSDVEGVLAACPDEVPVDDALDALIALWTAQRHARGTARCVPDPAPRDARGVPMRMTI